MYIHEAHYRYMIQPAMFVSTHWQLAECPSVQILPPYRADLTQREGEGERGRERGGGREGEGERGRERGGGREGEGERGRERGGGR